MFNEREIIPKVINGDFKAFDQLVKQYERLVYYIILKIVDNKEDAEDICQEVFIKVYKSLNEFAYQSKLSTWIAKVAYSITINHLRKSKNDRFTEYPVNVDDYHFTSENPEKAMIEKDTAAYINHLIAQMPHHYKTVLTLYHLNEFSYQEIQEITDLPEGTIKSYLFRGRKLLKEKLEQYLKNETIVSLELTKNKSL
jgi:RNA polymerase sigma factor (sigma-70 family)